MDAFTVSDSYPYSAHNRLGDDLVNYMRNSVKVVVGVYDGTTTFYVFDGDDPMIAPTAAFSRVWRSKSSTSADAW